MKDDGNSDDRECAEFFDLTTFYIIQISLPKNKKNK